MKKILMICGIFAVLIVCAEPMITDVKAQQRYPWNGKVDISYTVKNAGTEYRELSVWAVDRTTGVTNVAKNVTGDTACKSGQHKIVWDMSADGLALVSTNVVFGISYVEPLYCVIDLSGGTWATSYPVTYLADAPAGGWSEEYKTTKLVLRKINAGIFTMGKRSTDYPGAGNVNLHQVTLTKDYFMGVFEVTQRQWELVMGTRPSYYGTNHRYTYQVRPVERVSYDMIRGSSEGAGWPDSSMIDATSFFGRLRAKSGLDLDLPTEAQWEYACRAGTTTAINSGKNLTEPWDWDPELDKLAQYGDYEQEFDGTAEVGLFAPNAWGLYDMHGNVQEWCLDWYCDHLDDATDPVGPSVGSHRVFRGGSWWSTPEGCRSGSKDSYFSSYADFRNGFRLVSRCDETIQSQRGSSCSGCSDPVRIDLTSGTRTAAKTEIITCSTDWVEGAGEGATAVVAVDGTVLSEKSGSGTVEWTPTLSGTYELTHKVMVGGEQIGETLAATFFVNEKIVFLVTGYVGAYDGNAHGITVEVIDPTVGAVVTYSRTELGEYTTTPIMFTDKTDGPQSVYFRIAADGYEAVSGVAQVNITPKVLTSDMIGAIADRVYTGESHRPEVTVSDVLPCVITVDDYTVEYADNVNAGVGRVIVTGKGNYTGVAEKTFVIRKANYDMSRVAWDNIGRVTYDGKKHEVKLQGLPSGIVPSYQGNAATAAGSYVASATLSYDARNYNPPPSIAPYAWGIDAKGITVSAVDVGSVYGNPDAPLTYVASGLVGSDTLSGSLVRATGVDVGTYPITIGTLGNPNYSITFKPGVYTILPRPVTLTSGSAAKKYDGTPLTNPDIAISGSGWAFGEGATYDVTGSQTEIGESKNTFSYTLLAGTKAANYAVTKVEGTLRVLSNPKITDVTARQRYPWNGLVDIVVTMEGVSAEEVPDVECLFVATNSATGSSLPIASITRKGSDTGSGTTWKRRFVWDAANDVGAVTIEDVELTAKILGGVQLWENGPYWAECNVGATKPEEYGYYFWWGDTVGYKRNAANNGWISVKDGSSFTFTEGNCPTCNKDNSQLQSAGYIDATGNLVAAHDAATAHLGALWRMPTVSEIDALISNCDTQWTTRNGVYGRLVTGRGAYASKSIFLPAAGFGIDSYLGSTGSYGLFWSSSPYSDYSSLAWGLGFYSGDIRRDGDGRFFGRSVRPIRGFANGAMPGLQAGVGVTTHLKLDCRTGVRTAAETESITYSTEWVDGADEDAVAVVSVNGEVISEQSGSGVVEWVPSRGGTNVLTHVVMNGGVPVGETLTATFNVNGGPYTEVIDGIEWTYMANDGKATLGSGNSTGPTAVPKSTVGALVTPDRIGDCVVEGVADWAFHGCDKLASVVLSGGVSNIGEAAFNGCSGMVSIAIPSSVVSVGREAFLGCNGIRNAVVPGWKCGIDFGSVTNLVISEGTTDIDENAFSESLSLERVTIPLSVTDIGNKAFYGCSSLLSIDVDVGNQNYSSEDGVLFNKGRTSVVQCPGGKNGAYKMPSSVKRLEDYAFAGCTGLTSVTIPLGVTIFGNAVFQDCDNLGAVDFEGAPPSGVESAGIRQDAAIRYNGMYAAQWEAIAEQCGWTNAKPYAPCPFPEGGPYKELVDGIVWTFAVNADLMAIVGTGSEGGTAISSETAGTVVVPETLGGRLVTGVGAYAFKDCTGLTEVTLPTNVVTIGDSAFANDYWLDNVIIPDSVEEIGNRAFMNCTEMAALTFGKGLKRVWDSAFENCISLESVVFHEGLRYLGSRAFAAAGATRLKSVSLPASLVSIGSSAFSNSALITGVTVPTHLQTLATLFPSSCQKIETVVIPEGEDVIVDAMFDGCSKLVSVVIPMSVTNVGASAFANCSALVELGLPDEVTTLGARAFTGCSALKTVSLPRNLTAIADETFAACPMLDSLVIPASVTSLGHNIYSGAKIGRYFTANLTAVNFLGNAPETYSDSYAGMPSALTSYVVKGSTGWYLPGSPTLPPNGWPTTGNARAITYWTPNEFEVTFDGNGGSPETYVSKQITDTTYSLPKSDPVRDGYLFKGWWTEKEAGAQIYWNTRVTATKAHTLYAHWKSLVEMITVRFNPNGGTVEPSEKTYPPGVTFGELPVPTRIGHNFVGWYTSQVGGDLVTESTVVSKEHNELYAHWVPITYRVAFDANGGSGTMNAQTHTYNVAKALTANAYYLTGFNFTGWSETRGGVVKYGNQQVVENLAEIQGQVVTLYAVWVGAKYAVRFDANGGEGIMTNQTHQVGVSQALSKCTFTRENHTFLGWATTPQGVVEYEDEEEVQNLTMQASATVPLYAVWESTGVEAPVFSPKDGTVFKGSCTVTLTCTTPGASIYYRIGAKPKATSKYLYSVPFEITETSTVYAFAKLGDTESDCVTATYTKGKVITFEEAVKAKGITAFTHGGDAVWGVEEGLGEGDVCVRSGVIIDEQVSWFETTVQGPGTISFKWKASCEEDYPSHEWDHLAFNIDGAKDDYARLDGVTDWEEVSAKLEAGTHTLRWSYVKDESDAEGEDCGWVDCVSWVADAPAPVPPGGEIVVPEGKTAKEFADEVNKNKAQYLNWPLEGPVSTDYLGYFTAVPKGDAKVEFVLNESGTNEVVKATTTVKTAALGVVFSEGATLKIDEPLVGFYYSLRQGGDVTVGAKADLNKLGGRDEISFELTKGPFQYFYQTLVTPTLQK